MKNWIKNHEGFLALVVAIFALIISMKGCEYSKEALELSKTQKLEERLLIISGTIDKKEEFLKLKSLTSEHILQKAKLFYPQELKVSVQEVTAPHLKISTHLSRNALLSILIRDIPPKIKGENKDIVALYKGVLPIVVKSTYLAKGNRYKDTSLYSLQYESIIGHDEKVSPQLVFTSFYFIKRLELGIPITEYLSEKWSERLPSDVKLNQ